MQLRVFTDNVSVAVCLGSCLCYVVQGCKHRAVLTQQLPCAVLNRMMTGTCFFSNNLLRVRALVIAPVDHSSYTPGHPSRSYRGQASMATTLPHNPLTCSYSYSTAARVGRPNLSTVWSSTSDKTPRYFCSKRLTISGDSTKLGRNKQRRIRRHTSKAGWRTETTARLTALSPQTTRASHSPTERAQPAPGTCSSRAVEL